MMIVIMSRRRERVSLLIISYEMVEGLEEVWNWVLEVVIWKRQQSVYIGIYNMQLEVLE